MDPGKASDGKPKKQKPQDKISSLKAYVGASDGAREEAIARITSIIGGQSQPQKITRQDAIQSAGRELDRIKSLAKIMSKPPKSLMESGNLPDLRKELAQLQLESKGVAAKIVDAQKQISKIEQERNRIQAEIDGLKTQQTNLRETLSPKQMAEAEAQEQLEAIIRERQEEEIYINEVGAECNFLRGEYLKAEKEAKDGKDRLSSIKKNIPRILDEINGTDSVVSENLLRISDNEARIGALDKKMTVLKSALSDIDSLLKQKQDEEIALNEETNASKEIKNRFRILAKALKDSEARLKQAQKDIQKIPDKITRVENTISENLKKTSDHEKKLMVLDKGIAEGKTTLENAIATQRAIAQEYDEIVADKNTINEVFLVYEKLEKMQAEKASLLKSITGYKAEIGRMESETHEHEEKTEELKKSIAQEEECHRKLRVEQDETNSRIKVLESNFSVFSQLDEAAKEVRAINDQVASDTRDLDQKLSLRKQTLDAIEKAKKELLETLQKEDQLKKKLEEVLAQKKLLEEELKGISDGVASEQLIIELPDMLRDSIKKETEKLTAAQANILEQEKAEKRLQEEIAKITDRIEDAKKLSKLKEKQLLYVKNKLSSTGYDDGERLLLKGQLDSARMQEKKIEQQLKISGNERRHLTAQMLKAQRQMQRLTSEIHSMHKKIENVEWNVMDLEHDIKSTHEQRIKVWAGDISALRIFYPVKAHLDRILDEKSKIKAELDEASKMMKKVDEDMASSEKYVQKCREDLSRLEEDYVGVQSQIHSAEKQNSDLRLEKESLAKQLKDEQDHIPLLESEVTSNTHTVAQIKNQLSEKTEVRKQHERNVRAIESRLEKLCKDIPAPAQDQGLAGKIVAYMQLCRADLKDLEEEYVKSQAEIHSLEKQNADVKASKESLSRNLKAEQESIPFIEAEVSAVASKLASLKEQIAQKSETRKRHERSLREILTRLAKAKKAFESFQAQLRKTQDEVNQIVQKISENNQALAQESTKIMAIMNEKKENEKKLVEYKQRQTIIESEINVILKIYRPSSI